MSDLVGNPEDRFSRVAPQILLELENCCIVSRLVMFLYDYIWPCGNTDADIF